MPIGQSRRVARRERADAFPAAERGRGRDFPGDAGVLLRLGAAPLGSGMGAFCPCHPGGESGDAAAANTALTAGKMARGNPALTDHDGNKVAIAGRICEPGGLRAGWKGSSMVVPKSTIPWIVSGVSFSIRKSVSSGSTVRRTF